MHLLYDVSKHYAMYQNYTTYLHKMTRARRIFVISSIEIIPRIHIPSCVHRLIHSIIRCIENYTGQPHLCNIIYRNNTEYLHTIMYPLDTAGRVCAAAWACEEREE